MLLFAFTILVSAFLLFQVQPVIAKIILPWFGGSSGVWTTCLLFFQIVLLLGYLYAHWTSRKLRPAAQSLLHMGLLGVSLLTLPVLPSAAWKPMGGADPTFRILALLAVSVGLPYFLLSTTGPLLQAWYARRYHGSIPYRLYALSNFGSMVALLSYPVLVEPVFATREQVVDWSWAYVAFGLLCAATAWSVRGYAGKEMDEEAANGPAPGWRLHLLWLLLPATASALLLAVTNHLTQNVAAIPFLWVLPLSLYLLSFILCFDGDGWYRRVPYLKLLAVALGSMTYALCDGMENTSIKVTIPLFAAGLFLCCMVCHGELVRLKPHPRHLTSFYLMIALGGAVGGISVALIAPHVFPGYWELPIALVACAALVTVVLYQDSEINPGKTLWNQTLAVGAGITLAMAISVGVEIDHSTDGVRMMERNFYGSLKVIDSTDDDTRRLLHGTINHGEQFLDAARRDKPTTYYGPNSGVGLAIREGEENGPVRVGVIGLGTGTLATYGRPGDYYRFYEINPLVVRIAETQFTFLKDSQARVEVALGDARLSLEREPNQHFDVLAVDAFSGDSIPIHLLTEEAFHLYFRQLKETGVLAVHVSNRYLDLRPVVARIAATMGKEARVVDTQDDDANDIFGSTWVLVTGRRAFFENHLLRRVAVAAPERKKLRLWTDDYSNLFQILK